MSWLSYELQGCAAHEAEKAQQLDDLACLGCYRGAACGWVVGTSSNFLVASAWMDASCLLSSPDMGASFTP